MKQRIYTGNELSLEFNSNVLTFNGEVLTFYQKGLTHIDANGFVYNEAEMGDSNITIDINIEDEIDLNFTKDWYVEFRGERFYLSSIIPPVSKSTESQLYKYSLTFKSQRSDLDRYEFANLITSIGTNQPIAYDGTLYLTIQEFIDRLNINLEHYFGSNVWVSTLDPEYFSNLDTDIYDGSSRVTFQFSRQSIWSILTSIYSVYGLRWSISNQSGVMTITFGKTPITLDHQFEYGLNNGLIGVERSSSGRSVYTRLSGFGSSRNLPYRYFDSSTSMYIGDPNFNEYTKNIPYSNLMPYSYRKYVMGWNDADSSLSEQSTDQYYLIGYSDNLQSVFNPTDFLIDSSAEQIYGIRKGSIESNEDIYPTLQGVTNISLGRIDEVVYVEKVLNDEYGAEQGDVVSNSKSLQKYQKTTDSALFALDSDLFNIDASGSIIETSLLLDVNLHEYSKFRFGYDIELVKDGTTVVDSSTFYIDLADEDQVILHRFTSGQPGSYQIRISGSYYQRLYSVNHLWTLTMSNVVSKPVSDEYKQTFDIWIKNIWGSSQNEGESDADYMHRVWDPLLVPNKDITVMFSSGLLAGEDYEFKIARPSGSSEYYIYPDTSRSIGGVQSHWRLRLIKSDVNLESTKRMLPNMTINASAGDYMFFTNINMPYDPYVYNAEVRVDEHIQKELNKVSSEDISYTIKPSGIFLESYNQSNLIAPGNRVLIYNKKVIGSTVATFDISNVTIEYSADSIIPKWTITVSNGFKLNQNSIQVINGEMKVLSKNIRSAQEITEQVTRNLDSRYLKKDGDRQTSQSPTVFKSGVLSDGLRSEQYQQGQFGGNGYSIFKDTSGNFVLEIDKLNVRKTLNISELVVRQVSIYGGIHIYSAAAMTASDVDLTSLSYDTIYLDIKNGTVLNQFVVGDYAYCKRFSPINGNLIKYYWKEVVAVGPDYIRISKTGGDGSGAPQIGDNIAQLGNSSDVERQSALIIDQTAGGSVKQYAFINGFTLADKNFVEFGVNPATGLAYQRTYGDWYAGGRDTNTSDFIGYDYSEGTICFRGVLRQESRVIDYGGNQSSLLVDRGDYNPSSAYYVGNIVFFEGSTYRCKQNAAAGISPHNLTYWSLSAQKGQDGTSVKIVDSVDNSVDLPYPYDGSVGDGYIASDTGHLWVYTGGTPPWADAGQIKGDKGDTGANAPVISVSASSKIVTKSEIGLLSPETITIVGEPVNTAITTWSYSIDGGAFSLTPPPGIQMTGNVITFTTSMFSHSSISIKASDGTVSDTETISVINEGSSVVSAILSNESYTLTCDKDGVPLDYSGAQTNIRMFRGATELNYSDWFIVDLDRSEGVIATPRGRDVIIESIDSSVDGGYVDIIIGYDSGYKSITKRFSISKSKQGVDGKSQVYISCKEQSLLVSANDNLISRSIKLTLMNGLNPVPTSAYIRSKSLIGLSASSDTVNAYDYDINLTQFSNSTIGVGYVDASISYAGKVYILSISVARVSSPVRVIKGEWTGGISYTGNHIQQDVVSYLGSWYSAKTSVGSTSATWVESEWEPLNSFKNVATDTLLAENANIAGFIYKDEKMVSQSGTINGDASTNWAHPGFTPNLTLDGSTGQIIANNAIIKGTADISSGSIGGVNIGSDHIGEFSDPTDPDFGSLTLTKEYIRQGNASLGVKFGNLTPYVGSGGYSLAGSIQNIKPGAIAGYGLNIDVSSGSHMDCGLNINLSTEDPAVAKVGVRANGGLISSSIATGYGVEMVTISNSSPYNLDYRKAGTALVKMNYNGGAVCLPSKSIIHAALGILGSPYTPFCIEYSVICHGKSTNGGQIFGRTTLISGHDTSAYPYLRDGNYNHLNAGRGMGGGDTHTFYMVYDGTVFDAYLKCRNYDL